LRWYVLLGHKKTPPAFLIKKAPTAKGRTMPVSSRNPTSSRIPESGGGPPLRPLRKSQRQRILDRLIAARGGEVPSPELAKVSLQYNARVSELREAGFVIISRVEIHDGVKRGFFRLHQRPGLQTDAGSLK
jgi:hypothetical protein